MSAKLKFLAEKYGTPIYVYDLSVVQKKISQLKLALPRGTKIRYAMKANNNLQVLKLIKKNGLGLDVVSGGELKLGLKAGFKPSEIVFSGIGKSVQEIELAIQKKIESINVESLSELIRISALAKSLNTSARVSLRVNPNVDAKTHKHITTGRDENKFGISDVELPKAIHFLNHSRQHLRLVGLTFHIGSQISSAAPYKKAFKISKRLAENLQVMDFPLEHLSIGGGFGIRYRKERPLDLRELGSFVRREFTQLTLDPMCEPGRFLVAEAGVLLTKVEYIKKSRRKNFAVVNTGMHHLLRPALYDAYHEIVVVGKSGCSHKYDIVGPICESTDFLGRERKLPLLSEGDVLMIKNVGAYGHVMASFYNCHELPREIVV